MMEHPFFDNKRILVVDRSVKDKNDRTWCFWEQEAGMFESIVQHRWKQLDFYSNYYSARFEIDPYAYKMIRGIDFYNHVIGKAKQRSNIEFMYGNVQSVSSSTNTVTVDGNQYAATYIFNSIVFDKRHTSEGSKGNFHFLLQHFKGWLIQTPYHIFNEKVATFMDFRVEQKHGTTFVYVLPVATDKALVEYTLFTRDLLSQDEYDQALRNYIATFTKVGEYQILDEEFGIIPMTNNPFPAGEGGIVHIGTAGGQTKASSGFTFSFIQKHSTAIIDALVHHHDPHISGTFASKRFDLYDSTLLHILSNKQMGGDEIFADLFKKNPPQRVLRFLDNETNFGEELKIMGSVPTGKFLPAAMKELFRKL